MTRTLIAFLAAFAAYVAVLIGSQHLLNGEVDGAFVRVLLSLAPMVPAIFICGVIVHVIRRLDEMQRKLQLEALALAFAGTALISFSYGFLEGAGFPRLSMFAVWPTMAALWVVGVIQGRVRYG